jgi:hypothetical protein
MDRGNARKIGWGTLAGLLLLSACAVQRAPEGGPSDTRPPRLDSTAYSTPDRSVDFAYDELILTFDEWVKLNDPANQIVVSPLLKKQPEVKIRRRSVVLRFQEPLRKDLTYTVDFGKAVQDITQGNAAEYLRRVFSPGPKLDSAAVEGTVADAAGGELPENLLALLYEGASAQSVRDTVPLYLAKVDKQGFFRLQNLRADTFRLVVLLDQNLNYRYDLANEQVAFLDTALVLGPRTPTQRLRLFAGEQPLAFVSATAPRFGQIVLQLNQSTESLAALATDPPNVLAHRFVGSDKALLWYRDTLDSVRVFLPGADTVTVSLPARRDWLATGPKLRPGDPASVETPAPKGGRGGGPNPQAPPAPALPAASLLPGEPLRCAFNHPLERVDTSRLRVTADSVRPVRVDFRADVDSLGHLRLSGRWPRPGQYRLLLLPGAVTDLFGLALSDTLRQSITVLDTAALGIAEAQVAGLDSTKAYFLELLDAQKKRLRQQALPLGRSATWRVEGLKPATYFFRLVRDDNRNGRWDTGDYDLGRQPEPLLLTKGVNVRKDFEAILEIQFEGQRPGGSAKGANK